MIPAETYEGALPAAWEETMVYLAGKLYDWHDGQAPEDEEQWGEDL